MIYTKLLSIAFTFAVVAAIVCHNASCASHGVHSMSDEKEDSLPTGPWGGEHIMMQLTSSGATIEFDCAHGIIDQRIVLDRKGRFDIKGEFVQEGGPAVAGDVDRRHTARYTGVVDKKIMTLKITLLDKKEDIGTFTLAHGRISMLTKCY